MPYTHTSKKEYFHKILRENFRDKSFYFDDFFELADNSTSKSLKKRYVRDYLRMVALSGMIEIEGDLYSGKIVFKQDLELGDVLDIANKKWRLNYIVSSTVSLLGLLNMTIQDGRTTIKYPHNQETTWFVKNGIMKKIESMPNKLAVYEINPDKVKIYSNLISMKRTKPQLFDEFLKYLDKGTATEGALKEFENYGLLGQDISIDDIVLEA